MLMSGYVVGMKNLLEVVEACNNQNINYRVLDISDENQVESFVNDIIKKDKKIDALIIQYWHLWSERANRKYHIERF